jgi:hypothetical protein
MAGPDPGAVPGALVVAHGHDNGALLAGQMFVVFRHGGTLQQKVLHLVFENALSRDTVRRKIARKYRQAVSIAT